MKVGPERDGRELSWLVEQKPMMQSLELLDADRVERYIDMLLLPVKHARTWKNNPRIAR